MFLSEEAVKFYEENIKYFNDESYRQIANYLIEAVNAGQPIAVDSIMGDIQAAEDPNADTLIKIVSTIAFTNKETYSPVLLNDYYKVILAERSRIHDRYMLDKALEGKSPQEQARIIGDFLDKQKAKSPK